MVSQETAQNAEATLLQHGYIERKGRTLLILRGADSKDFVQRMSTNDISGLNQGPVQTVFTTEKGRIVDVVTVLDLGSDSILLAGISGDQAGTKEWLERFVIMDDVSISSASEEYRHILITGESDTHRADGSLEFRDDWGGHVVIPSGAIGARLSELNSRGYSEIEPQTLQQYRVLRGLPDWPAELSGDYNPLEAKLDHAVSWTKGCYVGQEVIARLDSYKKLQRILVSLLLDRNSGVHRNLYLGKENVGMITSVSADHEGKYHGMGYLKPSVAETKGVLEAGAPGSGMKVFVKEEKWKQR